MAAAESPDLRRDLIDLFIGQHSRASYNFAEGAWPGNAVRQLLHVDVWADPSLYLVHRGLETDRFPLQVPHSMDGAQESREGSEREHPP